MFTEKEPMSLLTIKGFKSIVSLDQLELRNLNVLIGANGSGKSNFVDFFRMFTELVEGRLQLWTQLQGSADRILSFGVQETKALETIIAFKSYEYRFKLAPTIDGGFVFQDESVNGLNVVPLPFLPGSLESAMTTNGSNRLYPLVNSVRVYHFHDTSDTSGVKRLGALHDIDYLRPDASNLAAFLYHLSQKHLSVYEQIVATTKLALPFFNDFVFRPEELPTGEKQIRLLWRQNNSDYVMWPSQLSDGAIRFVCLATVLLQPDPPPTIIIDEPELGLHPQAIHLFAGLLRSSSKKVQIVVSTQSTSLVNEFTVDDLVIVERENGASTFERYQESEFKQWLEAYTLGELWEKNILGGRPR